LLREFRAARGKAMPFRYSCFISYRHGQRKLAERIINDLYDALANEIETLLDEEVFVDRERLKGGTFYNEELASALCESACMIVVFTPTYFDKKHTFCAREYKAMEQLELQRLKLLGKSVDKRRGLIIPIVFRGGKYIPTEIKDRRQYYSFEDFQLSDVEISRHPNYASKIKEIAEYIADRYKALSSLPDDVCVGCSEFKLPTDGEITEWLNGMVGSVTPFVLRNGGQ
jgi:hypothetical protein